MSSKNPVPRSPQDRKVPVRQRHPQKPTWVKVVSGLFYAGFLGVVFLVTAISGRIASSPTLRQFTEGVQVPPKEAFGKDAVHVLMIGCDEQLAPGGKVVLRKRARADMILLARIDFQNKRITGVSLPRDVRVRLPGEESHKLNALYSQAKEGEKERRQKEGVEWLTKTKIDKVLVIDYVAFQDLVDQIGGVKINIKDRMFYEDKAGGLYVDFHPGPRLLSGYDAMSYVRFRKFPKNFKEDVSREAEGDFKRTERQREFLLAFKQAALSNPMNYPAVIEGGVGVLGEGFTPRELGSLLMFAKSVPQTSIVMTRLPTVRGRGTFEEIDREKSMPMLRRYGFYGPKAQREQEERDSARKPKR